MAGVALFSVLHVAMQLQRREIMVSFQRAVFLKLVLASVSAVVSILAATFGGLEFRLHTRTSSLKLVMGVCFYLQVLIQFLPHHSHHRALVCHHVICHCLVMPSFLKEGQVTASL